MNKLNTAYLSIGSNLGLKLQNLQEAVFLIQKRIGDILKLSNIYETPALGFEGADFLNACLVLKTEMLPKKILSTVLEIESTLGRIRFKEEGYQPRSIDIDILYYNDEILFSDTLILPHPELQYRKFVLKPLADIAPQFYHPVLSKDTRNLLQVCRDKSKLTKITSKLFKDRSQLFAHLGFIAIEGNIGVGKTTLVNKIANDFNGKLILERFADNPFLPKFYEDQSRYAFPLEMSFLADRYQQYSDDTTQYSLFKNFMVSDYDIYKSLIFAKVTLQEEEYSLYRKLFDLMYKAVKKPKVYIYLYQNTTRLLENIKKRGRPYELNISADYLEKINRGYFTFIKSYPEQNNLVLDINELDFVNREEDYESILKKIQDFAINLPS